MTQEHSAKQPRTLAEWCNWLCDKEMPIFSGTMRRINEVVNDATTGATELAHIVMGDPSLSAKVLHLSNTVYYNPSRQSIGTLTKAVVLLGSNLINEMALTASYIEAIQSAKNRINANREIVNALHAAVQAKSLAQLCRDPDPEEVFLAALLFNIGHVAFWCFEEKLGESITQLASAVQGITQQDAEKQVLGFSLRELGASLAKTWLLKGLIGDVHLSKNHNDPRIRLVHQAQKLAKLHGSGELNTKQIAAVLSRLEKPTGKTPEEMLEIARRNIDVTLSIAAQYGVKNAEALLNGTSLPEPMQAEESTAAEIERAAPVSEPKEEAETEATQPPEIEKTLVGHEPSPDERKLILQQIQQDITSQLNSRFDFNQLLEMIIEGIQRGIPMGRTLFAMFNKNHSVLTEKSAVGWGSPKLRFPLEAPVDESVCQPNIFTHAIRNGGAEWIRPNDGPKWERLYTEAIQTQFGRHECFIAPLAIYDQPFGVIYADRADNGRPLDQQAFNTFCYLAQQAILGLKLAHWNQ